MMETNIMVLNEKDWLKRHLFDPMEIDYLALIKGFILNPPLIGAKVENSISIHAFFVSEYETAKTFKRICEKFVLSLQLTEDVVLNKYESGHLNIESKSLSNYLTEINFEKEYLIFEPEKYFSQDIQLNEKQKFSFLLGKFIRFYKNDKFILIDDWRNYVVIDAIKSFCIGKDKLQVDVYFGVPSVTHITLNLDCILLEYLKYWNKKIVK